jgi:hypothetical protein
VGLMDRLQAARQRADGSERTVDLTAAEMVGQTPPKPKLEWGRPSRCPECNGRGYLDHIDMVDRIMYEHCTECAHKWTITQAQTQASQT